MSSILATHQKKILHSLRNSSIAVADWQDLVPGDLILINTAQIAALGQRNTNSHNIAVVICIDLKFNKIEYAYNGKIIERTYVHDVPCKYFKVKTLG